MTVTRSVVPGEWYAVLGDDVVVLLPPAAKDRVAAVWERVDEGAGFDEVLDALISRGLRDLPGVRPGQQRRRRREGRDPRRRRGPSSSTDDGPVTIERSAQTPPGSSGT